MASFVGLVWILSLSGLMGGGGLWQWYRLSQAQNQIFQRVVQLQREDQRLQQRLLLLAKDSFEQEAAVRTTLQRGRPDELVFVFKESMKGVRPVVGQVH